MNINTLIRRGKSGVYRFAPDAGHTPQIAELRDLAQRVIDSGAVTDKQSFLSASAEALRFPGYFGHNWDAFYDCLSDLAAEDSKGLVIVFTDLSPFARNRPEEFTTAVETMADAAGYARRAKSRLLILIGLNDTAHSGKLRTITGV